MTGRPPPREVPAVPGRTVAGTALEYARALIPHLDHERFRCDQPWRGLMGRGCRTCGTETVILIADFQRSGDLPVFEAELKPHLKKARK